MRIGLIKEAEVSNKLDVVAVVQILSKVGRRPSKTTDREVDQKKIRRALSDPEQDRAGRMRGQLRLITLMLCVCLLVL